jgi:predicted MFS family arabinose efflux permease
LLITVLAIATGALVANMYYAQPIIGTIGPAIGVTPELAGSITSLTQVGYGVGLFFLVPLADLVENKRLVLVTLALAAIALLACGVLRAAGPFFAASFALGLASSSANVLLPFVAHLVPEARRGRVVGNVMAGVLTGIMLARPLALFLAGSFGWRSVFWWSTALITLVGLLLAWLMPQHRPEIGLRYSQILSTMLGIFRRSGTLQRRATYQLLMFGAFNMFWTAVPLMLHAQFGLNEREIGLFALAGAGGALAAPFAGRLADRGLFRIATIGATGVFGIAFAAAGWMTGLVGLFALAIFAVLIDGAVQTTQVMSQRLVFGVPPAMRGRVNAIYTTCLFGGGAIGSTTATVLYHRGGWEAVTALGTLIGMGVLAACLAERGPLKPIYSPKRLT